MKADPGYGWIGRMSKLRETLAEAVESGILDKKQEDALLRLFIARKLVPSPNEDESGGFLSGLNVRKSDEPEQAVESSETPRLVRGFHDVLISIGILAAAGGLWGIGGAVPVVIGVWVLAEIFVRRQHLALPAFFLTLLFVVSVFTVTTAVLETQGLVSNQEVTGIYLFLALLVCLIPFYWRFQIPVSLASLIVGGIGLLFMVVLAFTGYQTGINSFDAQQASLTGLIGFVFALVLFLIAMGFDSSDIHRETRRSDVAFWLHLCAAPTLLYAILATLFGDSVGLTGNQVNLVQITTVIAIVAIMMLVGIVIDRRAFVTSGLISLGVAIYALAQQFDLDFTQLGAGAFLIVGLIVLTLGSSWQWMRKAIVGILPNGIQQRVPPIA